MQKTKLTKAKIKKLERKERNRKDNEWKSLVKARDGSKCVICGETNKVNVHHIIPREVIQLRWNVYNGICLCPKHHRFSKEISPHKNPFAFFDWMNDNRKEQMELLRDAYKNME